MADKNEEGSEQNSEKMITKKSNSVQAVAGSLNDDAQSNTSGSVTQSDQQQHQDQQPTTFQSFVAVAKSLFLRAIVIYFITSFIRKSVVPPDSTTVSKLAAVNIFDNGTALDLYMYISEDQEFKDFNNELSLFWKKTGILYGDWYGGPNGDGTFTKWTQITASESLKNNGSIYLHVYITRHGYSPYPGPGKKYSWNQMVYGLKQLNKFKRQRYLKTHNLLTGETALTAEQLRIAEKQKGEIVSHWHPNLTVNLVTDHSKWQKGIIPSPLDEYIVFLPDEVHYKPILYMNDYWNMMRDYRPINETTKTLDLMVTFQPLTLFRWQLYSSQGMKNKWANFDVFGDIFNQEEDEEDKDPLKEALLDTSPYLIGLTVLVSILHNIQFWNNRKSLEGLSVRSVFFNVFQSLVVLLYVLDNDTNTIVKISCFVGLAIEVWKINKAVDVNINRESKLLGILPRISFKDKGSYVESSTREYDIQAFKYLSRAIYPLLICYGIYSLIYQEHKGWYSWILSMLYGFLLTFGFIMMTPQLFINYKLKSVAHLPWRMMTYKALNTFVDDMFAFVIKMPTMYRLGCFRDDIIFFIFLYQKFIYKTDPKRVNEFGFSAEMDIVDKKTEQESGESNENGEINKQEKTMEQKKKD
ncbi:hypothetical protein RUM44_011865 [Polyplax serrata]|uniref:Cleft lip and palate associated transmembrane protein n=1 Tax=Polyplax serrata TaxID=468196 RepID=A0ABR1BDS7_POLSC